MLAPVTHILPFTIIQRERMLPVPGNVLVRAGQTVSATDVIAETNLNPEHLLMDVARGLGIPADRADQFIQCDTGDQLAEGDIIAGPVGLMRRVIRSPIDGQVILSGGGQVLIEEAGEPFQLRAGIPGEVVELVGSRGAVIEVTGALIQGVWGNGHIDFGVMVVLAKEPDQVLTPDQLDVSLRGSIALAAQCQDPEVLRSADDLPLRGLILASMPASLMPVAAEIRAPVILLEGFGQRPMNSAAFKLLSTNERREVALKAENWDRYTGSRPEIIIPLPESGHVSSPQETEVFALDRRVRVLRSPHTGEIGLITDLIGKVVFQGGLRAQAAEVHLENGESAIVPLANLEVLT